MSFPVNWMYWRRTVLAAALCLLLWPSLAVAGGGHGKYGEWKVEPEGDLVRYVTHGTTVWGHQFGLLLMPKDCDTGILWIEWLTTKASPAELKKEGTGRFEIRVGDVSFPFDIDVLAVEPLTPETTVFAMSNFATTDKFIHLLEHGKSATLRVVGPPTLLKKLDIFEDTFSLTGFAQANASAVRQCEALKKAGK